MENMIARKPQIGRYKVLNAYYEVEHGIKSPVAEVIFMEFGWTKFDFKVRKVRLRSLYNKCSNGPKEEYSIENLNQHYLLIKDMYEEENPASPGKVNYCVQWEVEKPIDYEEVKQQESELHMDFVLQEEVIALNHKNLNTILEGIEIDDIVSDEMADTNWSVPVDPEEEY